MWDQELNRYLIKEDIDCKEVYESVEVYVSVLKLHVIKEVWIKTMKYH